MTASVSSPADLVNLSLARLGFKLRIGSLYDGSAAAKLALSIFSQTRDEYLAQTAWDFAERNVAMTLLKSAPVGGYVPPLTWTSAYPPLPWIFQYAYASDSIAIRAVKPVTMFFPNFDPQPYVFSLDNDNSLPVGQQKVVLCNVPPPAIMVYTGQITDLSAWESGAIEGFAAVLARRMAPQLVGLDTAKLEAADEGQSVGMAMREQERGLT